MPTPQECPICYNEFLLEDYSFADDPAHEMCNGCWRSMAAPPDLGVRVHEEIRTDEKIS